MSDIPRTYNDLADWEPIDYDESMQIARNLDSFITGKRHAPRKNQKKRERKYKFHNGQTKLLIPEIMFLLECMSYIRNLPDKITAKPRVVYIGAASGEHITILAELFPMFHFDLYDPREIATTGTNITIFQDFFEEKDTDKYKDMKNVFLISDIRDIGIGKLKSNSDGPDIEGMNELVMEDMMFQLECVRASNPVLAFLKFRAPYGPITLEYLSGILYLQPWTKLSTEMRLFCRRSDGWNLIKYDCLQIEQLLAAFNVYRCQSNDDINYDDRNRILMNWDTKRSLEILTDYLDADIDNEYFISRGNTKKESVIMLKKILGKLFGAKKRYVLERQD